jgi:hypothetical protein
MLSSLHAVYEIFKNLSIREIWNEISVRYYIFDVLFLVNAALGLFVLGLKEMYPNLSLIPFFITESSYFLGSSFPLSISTMGFIYSYAINNDKLYVRKFFDYWFYTFVGGVLIFLILILIDSYIGMMISSNTLILGVIFIFIIVLKYLTDFYKIKFKHPTLLFLLFGVSLLILTGIFGVFNIYFLQGREYGSRLAEIHMWNYKAHTHAALLGWVSLSFLGMIYAVYPVIAKSGAGNLREGFEKLLTDNQIKLAVFQAVSMFFIIIVIEFAFYYDNNLILFIFGLLFSSLMGFSIINLTKKG